MKACRLLLFSTLSALLLTACQETHYSEGSFGADVELLQQYLEPDILSYENSHVAVLGAYQGKVITSSSAGMEGRSYGWFNRCMLHDTTSANAYFNLGGECRMWFGPEAGKYSLFFDPGVEQTHETIRLPQDLTSIYFTKKQKTDTSVTYSGQLQFTNYSEQVFTIDVERTISIFPTHELKKYLVLAFQENVTAVGYKVHTTMTNVGDADWSTQTGLLSIWDISSFPPSENTTVAIPIQPGSNPVHEYFRKIPSSHMRVEDSVVFYRGDGDCLNKIGILAKDAKDVMGSYSLETGVLTLVKYQLDTAAMYVNSKWIDQKDPYAGESVNLFNDGVMGELGPFGSFYELETSSSARELKVGESHLHEHAVFHFEGDPEALSKIANRVLGVKLGEIIGAL